MAIRHTAETVGYAFTSQYYQVLDLRPEDTHKFYKDSSVAGWEGNDGVVYSVTTMKDSEVQVKSIHAQDSLQGSILLVVTGNLIGKDNEVTRNFSHTFLLARQERGFFVLNDILRFLDKPPHSPPSVNDSVISELEVVENACSSAPESKGSALNPSYAEITAETISKPSPDLIHPKQPAAAIHKTTYLETLSRERSCPRALAVQIVRVSASDGSSVQAPKAQNGINSVGKIIATPAGNDETAMLFPGKGIYVGGLPPNTTKHELAEAVKIFGRVKKNDGVQDGFTYGFVHFESEESARKAVEVSMVAGGGLRRLEVDSGKVGRPVKEDYLTMAIILEERMVVELIITGMNTETEAQKDETGMVITSGTMEDGGVEEYGVTSMAASNNSDKCMNFGV
nr:ras GTPase-activating protein-binding protein 1-like [Ipomoea trifida]